MHRIAYEPNLSSFIRKYKSKKLPFYSDKHGDSLATWNKDFFFSPRKNKSRSLILIFDKHSYSGPNLRTKKNCNLAISEAPLINYYNDVAKALIVARFESLHGKQFQPENHAAPIINFISWLQNKDFIFSTLTPSILKTYIDSIRDIYQINTLARIETNLVWMLKTLQSHNVVSNRFFFKLTSPKSTSPQEATIKSSNRMPNEDCIAAALSIFYEIFPDIEDLDNKHAHLIPYENTRHRYTAGMVVLSISSTQRFAAENPYLARNMLVERKAGNNKDVYSYIYQGSKGFPVNQKHIIGPMYPFVDRVLKYCELAFEPARVLTRFYENSQRPAFEIMGNFPISDWHGCSPYAPLTIYQLGGLLGLYDKFPRKCIDKLKQVPGFPFHMNLDKVANHKSYNGMWFGIVARSGLPDGFEKELTLRQLQSLWIEYLKNRLPNFPYREHNNGNKVHLSDALVCFTGAQIECLNRGAYQMAVSPFAIESIDIAKLFYKELNTNFFTTYGYSSDFSLSPHQLRHYSNTVYQRSGVSDAHIALISGRKDVRQNAVYDHRTGEIIAHHLIEHVNKDKDYTYIQNNIITAKKYRELSGRAASDTGVGLCLQDLSQTPCLHLSDFKHHCVNCDKAAFCKGHAKAISAMEEDIQRQKSLLEQIYEKQDLHRSKLSREQFIQKIENISYYEQLIALMQDNSIENGHLIRLVKFEDKRVTFEIFDIKNRAPVCRINKQLPDVRELLENKIVEFKEKKQEQPSALANFLKSKGIKLS
ncbi:TPA: hypothetical protein I7707_15440 [Vibrio vulnificus]|uniref:hypothetical protein n=1 Tax=Vibrio vulnificus TaxID=672 RepID=UPI00054373DF|nr:hypothetical protein [Vibrio vulnificus]EID4339976.1 hypothetical protein [Vibrio vulnificus]EKY4880771.1 hypothetical protein [Vibrio vulnificus]ELY1391712.1 hypothetical protein [Vibrio vulnificus]KHF89478.1 hypothetical protein OA19_05635 [Vibrio vulnificus]KHF93138.1 hypothetical protein OA16_01125 [Vibrio vulnificus]